MSSPLASVRSDSGASTPEHNSLERAMAQVEAGKEKIVKFLNGWTREQEELMADWADIAGCYRWMHDSANKRYCHLNMMITIPVIILSTLTGTANFAVGGIIDDSNPDVKKFVPAIIGSLSLFAGILTTVGNFLRYAQLSESNRVSSIAWGKLQRQIAVELRLHPQERMDCSDFMKLCRSEMDRLIEQSPSIPNDVILAFEKEFQDIPTLKRPDIAHGMNRTEVFNDTGALLKRVAVEAAIMLKTKKKLLREEILPDLDSRIAGSIEKMLKRRTQTLDWQGPKTDTIGSGNESFVEQSVSTTGILSTAAKETIHIRVEDAAAAAAAAQEAPGVTDPLLHGDGICEGEIPQPSKREQSSPLLHNMGIYSDLDSPVIEV